jgi:hypothetical protein
MYPGRMAARERKIKKKVDRSTRRTRKGRAVAPGALRIDGMLCPDKKGIIYLLSLA